MSGLSKVPTALVVIFTVSLVILIVNLLYVLWSRRRFQQRSLAGGDSEISGEALYTPSKELLYFFCWKNQSQVEPNTAGAPTLPPPTPEEDEDDVAKWQMYGPPRFLFTIKEEEEEKEKEDLDLDCFEEKKVCLKDDFEGQVLPEIEIAVVVEVEVEVEVDEATPFSTPCGSPPFYTPCPSPSRGDSESELRLHRESDEGFSENESSFVTIHIHGQ